MSQNEILGHAKNEFLQKCLNGQKVCFKWEKDFTNIRLEIEIPSLSDNKFSSWGDWGPMYKIAMTPNQLVKVSSKNRTDEVIDSYFLENKEIELNSPADSEVRSQYPLYFKIIDAKKDLRFEIYLGEDGAPKRVKVFRNQDQGTLIETDDLQ